MHALWNKWTAGTQPEDQVQENVRLLQSASGCLPSQMFRSVQVHSGLPRFLMPSAKTLNQLPEGLE